MKMVMDSLRLSGQAGGVCVAEMEVVLQMSLSSPAEQIGAIPKRECLSNRAKFRFTAWR